VNLALPWRAVQMLTGALVFLVALCLLEPLRSERAPYVFLAALLAAGSMAVTDTVVALLVALIENVLKGRRA